uniref:Myomesin 1 n=1 Tax=Varanus komodoensis TaxID=61221 RepID=A0A8D2JEY2_VARKO
LTKETDSGMLTPLFMKREINQICIIFSYVYFIFNNAHVVSQGKNNLILRETEEFRRKLNEDGLLHAPEFVIKPRSHTVWEKQNVKLHCTVAGWPEPRLTWYKNNVPINVHAHPGKYAIESRYGMHSLEINTVGGKDCKKATIWVPLNDSALMKVKGVSIFFLLTVGVTPHGFASRFEIYFEDAFEVAFGREGETMSLGCTVIIRPDIKRFHPEIEWYRNGVLISPSKWVKTHWSGEKATLTLTHANKEDEGLYTLRVIMGDYYEEYSAYVFVRDADAEIPGAPGAPLDVQCLDANKDYVIISWKQPAVDGGSPVLGYFIDKCEVGTTQWSQCNETPVKFARFPVTGLIEGRSYIFRVRAVNNAGISIPSRVSEPVAALDPADRARLRTCLSSLFYTEGIVPGPPLDLQVTEATKNYIVLSWKPPYERGHEGVMYFVEKCVTGTENWQRVNTEIPVKSPRFALFDLAEGKSYQFRVRACNSAGIGEPSEATEATVVDIPNAPSNVVPTRNTNTSVALTWNEPKDAKELVGYYIEASKVGSGHWEPCNNNPVKDTRFTCHGLITGDHYIFRVRAVNAAGLSGFSPESEAIEVKAAIAAPSPPYDITVLESVRDAMVLGWKQPKAIGGAEITGYYVNYREVIDGEPREWREANIKPVSERAYRVHDLKENMTYQFQVAAVNIAGVGKPSPASRPFKCEEWSIAVPGPPHDLTCSEVRKDSLVVLWKPPVYIGRTPIIGYYVDVKPTHASEDHWKSVNEKAITNKFLKVSGLKEGTSYVFRVRAANKAGVGKPSDPTDPVIAETRPGTKEVVVEVDDDGVISLNFECDQMSPDSKFVWSKNYEPIEDDARLAIDTKGGKSKAVFKDLSEEDLGVYSCAVTDTDGVSSSYTIDEEEMKRLLALSHDRKFPVVPLRSELAVEILEKGQVRFWLQAEKLSGNAKVNFVFNDKEIFNGEIDHNSGMIEMVMDKLEDADEGTYTFQLQDGKATNQSSLVLIGDVFQKLQNEAQFQRQEWFRKQGPHFVEYLGWEVTAECNVLLKCKFSKKDAGVYEVILKDDRGKDKSILKLQEGGENVIPNYSPILYYKKSIVFSALSATNLKIQSTEEGIRLYSFVNYYLEDLRISWLHNDVKIKYTERVKTGVTGEQIWLQINEPTPNDKGKYILELFDGKTVHTKTVDLSGQGKLYIYVFLSDRARVLGGLPDVVTIQEGKALNLSCTLWGNPAPEITWLKNEKHLIADDHIILKYESGKQASFTITAVSTADSGRYSFVVKNQYGTETSDFTVSVFIPEEGMESTPEKLLRPSTNSYYTY